MKKEFQYAGHTFQGIRQFTEEENFRFITRQMQDKVNDLDCKWDWDEFYRQAGTDMDIFLMDGKYEVIPAHNGLFIWGIESANRYAKIQSYLTEFKAINSSLENMRSQYITLLKSMCEDFNLEEIPISEKGCLVHAPFMRSGMYAEVIRNIRLQTDGSLRFETYNGFYYDEQLVSGLQQLIKKTGDILSLTKIPIQDKKND